LSGGRKRVHAAVEEHLLDVVGLQHIIDAFLLVGVVILAAQFGAVSIEYSAWRVPDLVQLLVVKHDGVNHFLVDEAFDSTLARVERADAV